MPTEEIALPKQRDGQHTPGTGGVSGRSVAQRGEPEAQLSIRLSDEPVKGGVQGRDGQGGAATSPSWVTVRRDC